MQCLNGRAPPDLSEHCIPVSSADTRRHLRSANRHLLAVPRFQLNTYGRWAFSVAGSMAWNSLTDFIRDPTSSADCFRRLLKTLGVLNHHALDLCKSTHSLTHSHERHFDLFIRFCRAYDRVQHIDKQLKQITKREDMCTLPHI